MSKNKKETAKRKPTAKDWAKIRAMYLRGETLDFVMEQIPDLDIKRSSISERMCREGINKKKSRNVPEINSINELKKIRFKQMKGIFNSLMNLLMLFKRC